MATGKANGSSTKKGGAAQSQMSGSRYRSASMQRYHASSLTASRSQYQVGLMGSRAAAYAGSPHYGSGIATTCDDPYGTHYNSTVANHLIDPQGHYGIIGGGGCNNWRRPSSRVGSLAQLHHQQQHQQQKISYLQSSQNRSSQYDVGRSSSGIYGNNSSSSNSSDYADWQPQMRKVNSGGYLNSIFKSHLISSAPMGVAADLYGATATTGSGKSRNSASNHYAPSMVASRPLQSHMATLSKQDQGKQSKQQQQQQLQQQEAQQVGSAVDGPSADRSYDSSSNGKLPACYYYKDVNLFGLMLKD